MIRENISHDSKVWTKEYNLEGELIEEPMKDMESRIFQHEMDHMEGKDFTSHVSKLRMDMA